MSIAAPKYKDYYELLGLSKDDITPEKVKRAFMMKAMIWHPDKAPNEEAIKIYTRVYEDLQQAYKVLSNDETRRMYSDTQQTANHDLVRQERDLSYDRPDKYVTFNQKGVAFDRDAFIEAFDQTRTTEDQKLIKTAAAKTNPITNSEFVNYLAAREKEVEIVNVFNDMSFNQGLFNQVFDYNKKNQPNQALEEFYEVPVSAGLAELDSRFSGISLQGMNLSTRSYRELGPLNPRSLNMDSLTGPQPQQSALTSKEIEEGIKKIQAERSRLAKLEATEFNIEQSEIAQLYKTVAEKKA